MPEYERSLQDLREEIRSRSDIVDIIGGYVKLKRAGKNWVGLCPFHADKNPSFTVTQALQSYRCWACGEKGDVFTFIEKKESLEFIDAMEWLARRAGVAFERKRISPEKAGEREQMLDLNLTAVRFFQEKLAKSPDAQKYLANRGVLKETQEQFQIGFAAMEWEGLVYSLERAGVDLSLAERVGLVKRRESEGSGYYDVYRNRLIFPIFDRSGRVIAFGGRVMDDSLPKYINGVESPLFSKSQILYGLNFAHARLTAQTPPVFVEGYLDVVTAHQAGFTQCVATLGTAMTEEHAKMLARYSRKAIICFDSDRAGIAAALKNAQIWESRAVEGREAFEAKIARLPDGEDPDSLIKAGGQARFQVALDKAVPRVEFQIELALKRHDIATNEGKQQALMEVIPILASITSRTDRERYVQRLTHLHPAYEYNISRAIESMLADAEVYARQTRGATSPRDIGYPLTEQANRGPMALQPQPPAFRPPQRREWGSWKPAADEGGRHAEGSQYGRGSAGYGQQGDGRRRDRGQGRREGRSGQGEAVQSGLAPIQALTGPEKAERQILRALLSADWRAYVLNNLHPGYLVTQRAMRVFEIIARTSPESDGGIDALALLRHAEILDAEDEGESRMPDGLDSQPFDSRRLDQPPDESSTDAPTPSFSRQPFDSNEPPIVEGAEQLAAPVALDEDLFDSEEGVRAESEEATPIFNSRTRSHSAKIASFIRDLLEDSLSVMSNEPLSEAVVNDCIRRLQKHREDQAKRELEEMLRRDDLTPEQKSACYDRYHETMRSMRGSPPESA